MTTQLPSIPDWSVRAVFRKNVKELRKEARNLTQQALADRLEELDWQGHMSSATIAKIEKGERQVKIEEAIMIAKALCVGLVDLLRPPPGQSIATGRWLHSSITREVCGEAPWTKGSEFGRLPDEDDHWPISGWYSFRHSSGGLGAVWKLVGDLRGTVDVWDMYGPADSTPEFDLQVADKVDRIADLIAGHLKHWADSVRTEDRFGEPR